MWHFKGATEFLLLRDPVDIELNIIGLRMLRAESSKLLMNQCTFELCNREIWCRILEFAICLESVDKIHSDEREEAPNKPLFGLRRFLESVRACKSFRTRGI